MIKPGKYQHYKGEYYQVLNTCSHSETLEIMVHYQALYEDKQFWVRPVSMFMEKVLHDDVEKSRFTYVE